MNRHRRTEMRSAQRASRGFTLFELVVFILVVSIVFSVGMRRFQSYPGEAERANFLAITSQIKAAVSLQMMNAIAGASWDALASLENSNPMNLLLETPSNYVGEFGLVDEISMPRRTWYFDSFNGHLVYLVNDNSHLYSTLGGGGMTSIRFRIAMRYANEDTGSSPQGLGIDADTVTGLSDPSLRSDTRNGAVAQGRKWQGLVLEAVTPYTWERSEIELPNGVASR